MANLETKLGDVILRNPIVTASGTFGYGKDYLDFVNMADIGAITVKGVSPFPSHGNPTPRTVEVYGGMLNAIGLQNPGIDKFISDDDYLPFLRSIDTEVFVNIWGKSVADYVEVAQRLDQERDGIAALEVNISCPNIKEGGVAFGTDLVMADRVVSAVRKVTTLPLITKLSPNVTKIAEFAKCVVDAGSDMISLINTLPGIAIDIETRKPKIANITGGFSGPAIKPIAVRMVYEVRQAVDVPIIGMGGVCCAEDAIEFLIAGANAVGVGTAIFSNPHCLVEIRDGINSYLDNHGISAVTELVNTMQP